MQKLLILCFITLLVNTSCLHKVSQDLFPKSSHDVDFDVLEKRLIKDQLENYQYASGREFLLKTSFTGKDVELIDLLEQTLIANGFETIHKEYEKNRILSKRGITLHEWKSIMGVYYQNKGENKYSIYFLFKVSQDMTGNLPFNTAEDLAFQVATKIKRFNEKK